MKSKQWFYLLSPTRGIFRYLESANGSDNFLYWWAGIALFLNLFFLYVVDPMARCWQFWISIPLLWFLPYSRISEIAFAFCKDSFARLNGQGSQMQNVKATNRLALLGVSYVEAAVCFASLYFALRRSTFNKPLSSPFEAFYFSWSTITTTGYGDIAPASVLSRSLTMAETALGLVLIVLAVGTYLSTSTTT